jgi:hypothetical protein
MLDMQHHRGNNEPERLWFPAKRFWLEVGVAYHCTGLGSTADLRTLFDGALVFPATELQSCAIRHRARWHYERARCRLLAQRCPTPLARPQRAVMIVPSRRT